jgi:hypothetical protein
MEIIISDQPALEILENYFSSRKNEEMLVLWYNTIQRIWTPWKYGVQTYNAPYVTVVIHLGT